MIILYYYGVFRYWAMIFNKNGKLSTNKYFNLQLCSQLLPPEGQLALLLLGPKSLLIKGLEDQV